MRFVLSIAAAFVAFVSLSSAQARQVTEADITKLVAAATEKRKGMPLRVRTTTTGYKEGDSSESLAEYGPNDTYHYLSVRKSNGVETKAEGIRIGEVRYTRQKDGSWIKEPPQEMGRGGGQGSGYGSAAGPSIPPEVTAEYLYIGSEKVSGTRADRYRQTRIVKFASSARTITRRSVKEYWFNADGLLLKESSEDVFENSKQRYKSLTFYEYDKKIEISAPIPD